MKKRAFQRAFDPKKEKPLSKKQVLNALRDIELAYDVRTNTRFREDPGSGFERTKAESAAYFLRREIYALGCHMKKRSPTTYDPQDLIDAMRPKKTTRPDKEPGVFHALFMAMYDEDTGQSRRDRWWMAQELEYAWRHRVPPELLAGFLLQSGPRKEIIKKIKSGYIEPGFRELLAALKATEQDDEESDDQDAAGDDEEDRDKNELEEGEEEG